MVDDGSSDTLPLPGPLRGFDGVLAVATRGGDILLVDLCRQVINEGNCLICSFFCIIHIIAFFVLFVDAEVRDEVNPCELMLLTRRNIHKIEHYKEKSMGEGFHLAINLNGQCLFDTLFTVWLCSFTNQLTICSILNVTSFVFIIQAVPNERLLLN